jgi:carbonic anhydrase/acetyltransferase-like protein (isoleucine patch superfamily)
LSVFPYLGRLPLIDPEAFVAPTASVVGDVVIGAGSSVWWGAVIRGDVMPIRVGARTSIQDNCVLHATGGWWDTTVGDDCTIGHSVILHGCTVGSGVLVGMGSVVLDEAHIGDGAMIGAGSLVTARAKIPPGVLAHGRPCKVVRELTDEERAKVLEASQLYVRYAREHRESLKP